MSIEELFNPDLVMLDLEAEGKLQVLELMLKHAVAAKALPTARREQVLEILLEREARGSTAFGGGMAMPHARVPRLRKAYGLVARSQRGLDFQAIDGEPVYVLVMLVYPDSKAEEHLETLRWISTAARDPDFQSFILQAKSAADVIDVLHEKAP